MKMNKTLAKLIASPYFSFGVTVLLFIILYGAGIAMYKGFMRPQVFFNLFIDNAALIIVAVGITFCLIIAGIDLSVGAVLALVCMVLAWMLANTSIPVFACVAIVLVMGTAFGAVQGYIITKFDLQPFIITLAGMFFCRGMTAVISQDTIQITDPTWVAIASYRINLGVGFLSVGAVIALLSIIIAAIVLGFTKFGRAVYAVGGSESSAALMGLPVFRTKVMVYTISGFCSALGGIAYSRGLSGELQSTLNGFALPTLDYDTQVLYLKLGYRGKLSQHLAFDLLAQEYLLDYKGWTVNGKLELGF